jgi:hypothetical protein
MKKRVLKIENEFKLASFLMLIIGIIYLYVTMYKYIYTDYNTNKKNDYSQLNLSGQFLDRQKIGNKNFDFIQTKKTQMTHQISTIFFSQ